MESRAITGYYRNDLTTSVSQYLPPELVKRMHHANVNDRLVAGEQAILEELSPSIVQRRLKLAWWMEYEKSVQNPGNAARGIQFLRNVAYGVAPYEYLLGQLDNEAFLAYLMCPPQEYTIAVEEALTASIDRIREILSLPLMKLKTNRDGEVCLDHKGEPIKLVDKQVMDTLIKVYKLLDDRVKGSIPQSIHLKGVIKRDNVRTAAGSTPIDADYHYGRESVEDLERQLQVLEGVVSSTDASKIAASVSGMESDE
jgi:hypothetical protein